MKVVKLKEYSVLSSLMVMLTRACQLSCVYCRYDKTRPPMSRETLRRSIDLLFTSECDPVRLQFFGGEPLLRPDLMMEGIDYARNLSATKRRGARLTLTTNALLLDEKVLDRLRPYGVDYLISFDGGREVQRAQRPLSARGRGYPYAALLESLRLLAARGEDFFVNMVSTPESAARAGESAVFLGGLGVRKLRFAYRLGAPWSAERAAVYFASIRDGLARTRGLEIINPLCLDEPDIITPTPKVDCDGTIYIGSVIPALERTFARLVPLTRVGTVRETRRMAELKRDRSAVWNAVRDAYPRASRQWRAVDSTLRMGLLSDAFFDRLAPRPTALPEVLPR